MIRQGCERRRRVHRGAVQDPVFDEQEVERERLRREDEQAKTHRPTDQTLIPASSLALIRQLASRVNSRHVMAR